MTTGIESKTDGWLVDITNSPAYSDYLAAKDADTIKFVDKRNITTILKNRRIFINTFVRNANLAAFRYDVDGLPDTINPRQVKQGHLWFPGVCYFELDDIPGYTFALPAVPGGRGYNMNGDPTDAYTFSMNGDVYHIRIDIQGSDVAPILEKTPMAPPYKIAGEGHGVFVRENYEMYPFVNQTIFYADQIADTMRAMENNRYWLKHPVGMHGTEDEKKTWEKYIQTVNDNNPWVWIYDSKLKINAAADHVEPSNMNDATDFTRPCSEVIDWFEQQYWRECGIQNMGGQIDKKGENLQTAEVTHTDDYTSFVSQMLLDTLNDQLDMVHKLPGCEGVKYVPFERRGENEDIRNVSEGPQNGSIPDNATAAGEDNGQ